MKLWTHQGLIYWWSHSSHDQVTSPQITSTKPLTYEPSSGISNSSRNTSFMRLGHYPRIQCFRENRVSSSEQNTHGSDPNLSHVASISTLLLVLALYTWLLAGGQSVIPGGLEVLVSWWPAFPWTRLAVAHLRCGWIQMFALVFLISLLLYSQVISSYPRLHRFTSEIRIIVEWLTREVNTSIGMMEHKVSETKENLFVVPQSKRILKARWSEGSSRRESESLGTRIIGGSTGGFEQLSESG